MTRQAQLYLEQDPGRFQGYYAGWRPQIRLRLVDRELVRTLPWRLGFVLEMLDIEEK